MRSAAASHFLRFPALNLEKFSTLLSPGSAQNLGRQTAPNPFLCSQSVALTSCCFPPTARDPLHLAATPRSPSSNYISPNNPIFEVMPSIPRCGWIHLVVKNPFFPFHLEARFRPIPLMPPPHFTPRDQGPLVAVQPVIAPAKTPVDYRSTCARFLLDSSFPPLRTTNLRRCCFTFDHGESLSRGAILLFASIIPLSVTSIHFLVPYCGPLTH